MSEPLLSEIKILGFNFNPRGWAKCDGQLLPIAQNQALFSLLGTMYGGDGRVNFALPDFRGRTATHADRAGFPQGQKGGQETHTLLINEIPVHNHQAVASANAASVQLPTDNYWSHASGSTVYGTAANTNLSPEAISNTGGSQGHENRSPYLVLNVCIATQGLFPSRN